jgi:hypothetical protein
MLKSKGVPSKYWGEAVTTAVYLLNRSPTKSVQDKTPYEAWHGKKPRVDHLRTFGCLAHVKKIGPGVGKLSDRSTKMVLLGYEAGTKGYRLVDPSTEKLHISRVVVFEEDGAWNWNSSDSNQSTETFTVEYQDTGPTIHEPVYSGTNSGSPVGGDAPPHSPQSPATPVTPQTQPQSSGSASTVNGSPHSENAESSEGVPLRYRSLTDLLDSTEEIHDFEYSGLCLLAADEPVSVASALTEQCWREAMNSELQAIEGVICEF